MKLVTSGLLVATLVGMLAIPGACSSSSECTRDSQCDDDEQCEDGACVSAKKSGATACTSDADCPAGEGCDVEAGTDAYCTKLCTVDGDCENQNLCPGPGTSAPECDDLGEHTDGKGICDLYDGTFGPSTCGGSSTTTTTTTTSTSTTDTTTSSAPCASCLDFIQGTSSDPLCEASQSAYNAFAGCICAQCPTECADACTNGTPPSAACNSCGMTVATGACSSEYLDCSNH